MVRCGDLVAFIACVLVFACSAPVFATRERGLTLGLGEWAPHLPQSVTRYETVRSLREIANLGAKHIRLVSSWYMWNVNETEIAPFHNNSSPIRSPDANEIVHTCEAAKAQGLDTFYTPLVDPNWDNTKNVREAGHAPNSTSRSDIGMGFTTDAEWDAWFQSYEKFILYHVALARRCEATLFSVASQLDGTYQMEQLWRRVIASIRKEAPHMLLTVTSATPEVVPFWDVLDVIGISSNPSLRAAGSDDVDALTNAWKPYLSRWEAVSVKEKRRIVLTDIGYQSRPVCYDTPWATPRRSRGQDCSSWAGCFLMSCQANAYKALFAATDATGDWLAGLFVQGWRMDLTSGGTADSMFTPRGKPAERPLRRWLIGDHAVAAVDESEHSVVSVTVVDPTRVHADRETRVHADRERLISAGTNTTTNDNDNDDDNDNVPLQSRPASKVRNGFVFGLGEWLGSDMRADSADVMRSVDNAISTGANALEFPVTWFFVNKTDTEVWPITDDHSPLRTTKDNELTAILTHAKRRGLRVCLTPMLDPTCQGFAYPDAVCYWRAELGESFNATQWNRWFDSYTKFVLHYAKLAGSLTIDVNGKSLPVVDEFLMSHELNNAEAFGPEDRWEELTKQVRSVFRGQVGVALNWAPFVVGSTPPYGPDPVVPKWVRSMDYIGVDCYFPFKLTAASALPWQTPDSHAFDAQWKDYAAALANYSAAVGGKPMVCTEVGYQSRPNLWNNPPGVPQPDGQDCSVWDQCYNLENQAVLYDALLRALSDEPWWGGVYWWLWRGDPSAGGTSDDDFTPAGKTQTLRVLDKYWKSK